MQTEVVTVRPDDIYRFDTSKVRNIVKDLIRIGDSRNVIVSQKTLSPHACDFIDCVYEQDAISAGLRLLRPANHDASFHRRIVEEIWAQSDDAINQISFNKLAAHLLFNIAEKNSMRKENSAAARLRL